MARSNKGRPTHHNSIEIEASEGFFAPLKLKEGTLLTTPEQGAIEFKDGHLYFTGNSERYSLVQANSVVTSDTTVTNTTDETVVHSKIIPANTLHEDMVIKATVCGSITNASASDDFTVKLKFGGSTLHTLTRVGGNVSNAGWLISIYMTIRTTGATGTLVDFVEYREGSISQSSADATTHTIDTTSALTLELTLTWVNAKVGNVFTSNQGFLELLH